MFSVTLSVAAPLREPRPRVLRGTLPFGVRTFLWRTLRLPRDHVPSRERYHHLELGKACSRSSRKENNLLQRAFPAQRFRSSDSSFIDDMNAIYMMNPLCQ